MQKLQLLSALLILGLFGCAQAPGSGDVSQGLAPAVVGAAGPSLGNGTIEHVVIIVQENRTPDNLFNGLPGADTARYGQSSKGKRIRLQPIPLTAPYDISHRHSAFEVEYAQGNLNGFNLVKSHCNDRRKCPVRSLRAYGFVPRKEVEPYFAMAKQYAFADRMFETNEGPSFPAHQYILSGTSTIGNGSALRAAENPRTPSGKFTGGCDSPPGSLVSLIDSYGNENRQMFPCFKRLALTDLVEAKSLTWHYYQAHSKAGLWNAPDAILKVRKSAYFKADVVAPSSQIFIDIALARLANVVWVTPTTEASDHAGQNNGSGPAWVASIVNAIGESPYWDDTAIFVVWDDWGGWYDHVKPPLYNSYELGFRVPLIAIGPYAKQGYVSHHQHEFGSILKFVENAFHLGSLGTTDVRADDLSDCFNFSQQARAYMPIPTDRGPDYFLRQPISLQDPDDDF